MKRIRIEPFPNFNITEDAFKNVATDAKASESNGGKKKKSPKLDIKVTVGEYNNGEKRVNFVVPVKAEKTFWAIFPDPIQLYFSQAISQFNIAEHIRKEKFIEESLKVKDEEIYFLNSNSDHTNELFNIYLQHRIGAIIMLVCSLEAFVNSLIPEGFSYINDKGVVFNKIDVQKKLSLKEKVEIVIPKITLVDVKKDHPVLKTRVIQLNKVRNEFVHLKNYGSSPFSSDYHKLFKDMLNFDILKHIEAVKEYVNLNKKDFFLIKE